MNTEWQEVLGKMTYGIYVLTTSLKEEINGMIASWVSQVSYEPPLIMVAIHPNRYSHHMVKESGHFVLHLVGRSRSELLGRFKGPDPSAKFASIEWKRGKTGCPILEDCLAYLECDVQTTITPGNHTLFLGEVKEAQVLSDQEVPFTSLDYRGVYEGKD